MALSASLAALGAAQKPPRGVPAYTLYVNRRIGRLLAAASYEVGLTPNHVTTISALLTVAGLLVLTLVDPSVWTGAAVASLLALGYAFDSADGQLARLRGTGGPAGEWYDHVVDCAKTVALHASVLVAAYRFLDPTPELLLLPLAYQLIAVTLFFNTVLTEQLLRQRTVPRPPAPTRRWRPFLMLPVDFGVLCLVLAFFASGDWFWLLYGLLGAATLAFSVLYVVQSYRGLTSAARPSPTADAVGSVSSVGPV